MSARHLLLGLTGLLLVAGCSTGAVPAVEAIPVSPTPVAVAEPVAVTIPALRVSDNLVPVGVEALENGELLPVEDTGWYRLAPKPGEIGRAVLAGHIDWKGTPGAFKHLPDLKPGDLVTTKAADGAETTFEVYTARQVKKADYAKVTVPLVFGPTTYARELALVTCSGNLVGHSYDSNTVVLARAL